MMMNNYIRQPANSNLCGQTCVAMVAGVPLDESIKAFGTKGSTNSPDVIRALRNLNIPCGDKLIRIAKNKKTDFCMVTLHARKDKKYLHWVIYKDGMYYDPASGIGASLNGPLFNPFTDMWHTYEIERYETSYLPIYYSSAEQEESSDEV